MIALLVRYFETLGITGTTLLINSMGDDACRPAYREKIAAYIRRTRCRMCARSATVALTRTRFGRSTARIPSAGT